MTRRRRPPLILPMALASLLTGGLLVHLASSKPDGLESVAERQGFASRERALASAPVPDYELPFWRTSAGKSLVGLAGTLITFGLLYGLGRLLLRRRSAAAAASASASAPPPGPLPEHQPPPRP